MLDYVDPKTDFIRNETDGGKILDNAEQSALNLLVELGADNSIDNDLFAISIVLQLTVEQAVNVKSAYTILFNEDLG